MKRLLIALTFTLVAAFDMVLAADGMMKTRKLPSDAVAEPPAAIEEYKKLPKDQILAPEHMQPGTHTVSLDMARFLPRGAHKLFEGFSVACRWADVAKMKIYDQGEWGDGPPSTGEVGWGEIEWGDGPCAAIVRQLAVAFDDGVVKGVPEKTIDRVVLTYDERVGYSCGFWVYGEPATCWQNGEGNPEPKPDGCVVVRVPTVDWSTSPPGQLAYADSAPAVRRISTREWDVTEPYVWQNVTGGAPLGANPTYGFLLTGSITSLDDLEGEDDTICMSIVTNVKLNVTYTVPEPSAPPPVVR